MPGQVAVESLRRNRRLSHKCRRCQCRTHLHPTTITVAVAKVRVEPVCVSLLTIEFVGVPFDVISQAQKLCRYANSALEHEDVATAVKNCEQVLQLLRPYNN